MSGLVTMLSVEERTGWDSVYGRNKYHGMVGYKSMSTPCHGSRPVPLPKSTAVSITTLLVREQGQKIELCRRNISITVYNS